jgi:hypothetical protein
MPLLSCPGRELYAAGCINHRIDHQLKTCLLADNAGQRQVVGGGIFDPMAFTSRVPSNFEAGQDQVIDEDLEESALFNLCRPYQSLELIGPRVASKSPLCGAPDWRYSHATAGTKDLLPRWEGKYGDVRWWPKGSTWKKITDPRWREGP